MTGSKSKFNRLILVACGLAVLGLATAAHADSSATRAARLTYLQGTVTVNQPDNNTSIPAQLNLPLLSGIQVSTGDDGQAEVEFEDGSVVRLTPNSSLSLDRLAIDRDNNFITDLSLLRGLAYAELRATSQYRYSLNVGGDVISPVENVTVRINFDQSPAIFSVLDGTAHVERLRSQNSDLSNPIYQADIRAGESFRTDVDNSSRYFLNNGIDPDSWDQWNEDLDQSAASQAADSTSVRNDYAGAQGYGWSDLDANGNWYNVPGQGPVWQPQVAIDDSSFDPYGNGAWVAYSSVGYVWASAYPWGWTPYRCGNWSYFNGFGWGWAPGSGCGGSGWGFVLGGRPVNIAVGPGGYRPIRVPLPGHGPERPWMRVGGELRHDEARRDDRSLRDEHRPRQIAGVTAAPIATHRNGFNPSGSSAGSSLRRDFPVDSKTRAPILGLAGTRPAVVHPTTGWQQPSDRVTRPGPPATTAARPTESHPTNNEPYRHSPGNGYEPANSRMQRPTDQSVPAPRSSPPPVQSQSPSHPMYVPAQPPPSEHRTYTPPPSTPAEHPTYSPPPSAPAPHPTYTPPPSPPPAPAPSAPAATPHPSANAPR